MSSKNKGIIKNKGLLKTKKVKLNIKDLENIKKNLDNQTDNLTYILNKIFDIRRSVLYRYEYLFNNNKPENIEDILHLKLTNDIDFNVRQVYGNIKHELFNQCNWINHYIKPKKDEIKDNWEKLKLSIKKNNDLKSLPKSKILNLYSSEERENKSVKVNDINFKDNDNEESDSESDDESDSE